MTFSCGTRTSSKVGEPVGEPLIPSLCSSLPRSKPGAVRLDDEGAGAAVLAVGGGEDHVEVGDAGVGDPVLLAVDHPFVAVAHGAGPHRGRVRARLGLREREGRRPLAAGALRQEALLQLLGAEELDRQRAELLHHQDQRRGGAGLGDLLDRHLQHQRAGAGAPVLGRRRAGRGCRARRTARGCPMGTRSTRRSRRRAVRSAPATAGGSFRAGRAPPAGSRRRG